MKKLALAFILLLNICSILFFASFQIKAQIEYSIEVRSYTWDKTTISVSILPQENKSWWKPFYRDAVLHGITQWNDAINEFASNHTTFSYVSQVRLVPTISYENVSGFDVYIRWIAECGSEATIGQSRITAKSPCIATDGTVCLAAKAPSGHVMTEVDMQNIVVHELGHTLGLSHCNYSSDVMYPTVYYRDTVKPLSSLNLYAVSQIFEWIPNSSQSSYSIMCPEESVVTMPSSISYNYFQIATENLPVSQPQNLTEYVIGLFMRPETLTALLVLVTLIAATTIFLKRKKKPQ